MNSVPPRGQPVVTCPGCTHPINEHISTESSGTEGGGLNGCEHQGESICTCYWTPNDIAAARLARVEALADEWVGEDYVNASGVAYHLESQGDWYARRLRAALAAPSPTEVQP